MHNNEHLIKLVTPNLCKVGNDFLCSNTALECFIHNIKMYGKSILPKNELYKIDFIDNNKKLVKKRY